MKPEGIKKDGVLLAIRENRVVSGNTRLMVLDGKLDARPGQFLQVRVSGTFDPLLRRPLSIHDAGGGEVRLLYREVGRGTALLAGKRPGEFLDVLGPLGNGFPAVNGENAVLVAGGLGMAPLYFLARRLFEAGKQVYFLLGARQAADVYIPDKLPGLVRRLLVATEDGSMGTRGMVTDLLAGLSQKQATVFCCGPWSMMEEVTRLCAQRGWQSYVSLEARMACGVGACQGCVVLTARGYRRVCADGPVFAGEEVFAHDA